MALRVIFLLECDSCRDVMTSVLGSNQMNMYELRAEGDNLKYQAEQSGWCLYESHTCASCVIEAQFENELRNCQA